MLVPAQVRSALDTHAVVDHPPLPGRRNHLPAGILVPLQWRTAGVDVVLTRRSPRLSRHAGEISFPGGRPDPEDGDLVATALREAEEELGIRDPEVLGTLCSMPVFTSDYRLHPTVARIDDTPLRPEPGEVAEVVRLDLESLLEPDALEGIPYVHNGQEGMSPLFHTSGGGLVFGATAHTLLELLQVLAPLATGGRLPPLRRSTLGWAEVSAWAESAASE